MGTQVTHFVELSPFERNDVAERCSNALKIEQAGKIHSDYGQFVDFLFKEMDTLAASVHHAASGVAGEGGEILDITKKAWAYNKSFDSTNGDGVSLKLHLLEELGDMRFYYQKLLNMLGVTDLQIQLLNKDKLHKRYPAGYSDAAAIARADKA